jgi:hypothetical protein
MANLYVFHQGYSNEGHLWFSAFDGTYWSDDFAITNAQGAGSIGMTAAPSAFVGDGSIFVFHQGYAENGQLWYTYTGDLLSWERDTQVQNVGMSRSPSVVFYNRSTGYGFTYVFHQGGGNNGQLWYTVFDANGWEPDRQIQNLRMSNSPSAVAWAGGITVFYQGANNNGQLSYTYSPDGATWGGDTLVPVLALTDSPSAVVYNGLLYVFHQGGGNEGRLRYAVYDGTNWSADIPLNIAMSGSPSAVVWAGGITVFHQGNGDGHLWYTYSPDGTNWGPDTLIQSAESGNFVGITDSPSAVVF